jgi:hypothetical protein
MRQGDLMVQYALRSVQWALPWVRRVVLVGGSSSGGPDTAAPRPPPAWLNVSHPRVRYVVCDDIFPDPSTSLPTRNLLAIEVRQLCFYFIL